jgi:hypothetical protein
MIDATRTNHTLCLGLSWQKAARGGRSDFTKGGRMGPHLMEVVVEGKRTGRRPPPCWRAAPPGTTCSATSPGVCWRFASAASTSRPWSPGRGWERVSWQAFLFRTPKGNHFVQFQSTWPGARDRLLQLSLDEAMRCMASYLRRR